MAAIKKATDSELIAAYKKCKSVWSIAEQFGMCGQSVHERLKKLGVDTSNPNKWTDEQIEFLKNEYDKYAESGTLGQLADILNKHKTNICRKARSIGLTSQKRQKSYLSEKISKRVKEWMKTHDHPRGFLGGRHSDEFKAQQSRRSKERWQKFVEQGRDMEIIMKSAKTRAAKGSLIRPRSHTTWKQGWRNIGGVEKYYRSKWEANYARYLNFLMEKGEIQKWEHEAKTFWFEGVRRGCVSYLPDFEVVEKNGEITYHEVKGWMDDRSKTKLKRMAKFYPDIKIILIQKKEYEEIKNKLSRIITGWE